MLNNLSKYRREIMGFSIILIMICHTNLFFDQPLIRSIYHSFVNFCKIGVDIFFLMSGIGLYFSFSADSQITSFLKKRFSRIVPTYLAVMILWGLFALPISLEDSTSFLWKYSLVSFFVSGEMSSWFIAAILTLYMVFPLIYQTCRNHDIYILILLVYAVSLAISLMVGEASTLRRVNEAFFVRIPSFLFGIRLGYLIKHNQAPCFSRLQIYILGGLSLIIYVINAKYNPVCTRWAERLLFLPLSFVISSILTFIMDTIHDDNPIRKLLVFLGGITLEIYLTHEKVLLLYNTYIPRCTMGSLLANCSAIVIAVLLSYIISVSISQLKHTHSS